MNSLLRPLLLLVGVALIAAPPILSLQFTLAVGQLPTVQTLLVPLAFGFALGGGFVLVGLPRLVVGPQRPALRHAAALLLTVSSASLVVFVGFSGSITRVASPVALLLGLAAFLVFVWPAYSFTLPARSDDA